MEDERLYYCVIDVDHNGIVDIFDSKDEAEKFIKASTEFAKVYNQRINYRVSIRTRDAL